jgi:hypothetical protein
MMTTEPALTEDEAEAMLKRLTRHYREPVQPISRYCRALETWGRCMANRAATLQKELLPNLHEWGEPNEKGSRVHTAVAEQQWDEYNAVYGKKLLQEAIPLGLSLLPKEVAAEVLKVIRRKDEEDKEDSEEISRADRLAELLNYERAAHQVERVFLAIHKSNLLARLLYVGEKLRTTMCPEHKGHWSGIEFGPDGVCPHKCQLTGWIQESDDQGKPLPGVQAVNMVPTGAAPGEVTMIRSVDGEVLGKAVVQTLDRVPVKPEDLGE